MSSAHNVTYIHKYQAIYPIVKNAVVNIMFIHLWLAEPPNSTFRSTDLTANVGQRIHFHQLDLLCREKVTWTLLRNNKLCVRRPVYLLCTIFAIYSLYVLLWKRRGNYTYTYCTGTALGFLWCRSLLISPELCLARAALVMKLRSVYMISFRHLTMSLSMVVKLFKSRVEILAPL